MPFPSVSAAKAAGFPAVLDKAALTIAQINDLARYFDEAKKDKADEPMQAAIGRFKNKYELKAGKWAMKSAEMSEDALDLTTTTGDTEPKVLFGPGLWKGIDFTLDVCRALAKNFSELAPYWKPQVTLEHDPEAQKRVATALGLPFGESGMPSLGEAANIWWDDKRQKGMHVLTGLPEKLKALVRAGRFKRVSMRYLPEYVGPDGKLRKHVIKEIGLLGVELPGMPDQTDQLAIAGSGEVSFDGQTVRYIDLVFSEDEATEGGNDMELQELQEQLATLKAEHKRLLALIGKDVADVDGAETILAKFTKETDGLKSKLAELQTKIDEHEKAAGEAAEAQKKSTVDVALDALAKEGKVLPTEKDDLRDVALSMDDTESVTFSDRKGKETKGTAFSRCIESWYKRGKVIDYSETAQTGDEHEETTESTLTDTDREVFRKMGVSEEDAEKYGGENYDPIKDVQPEKKAGEES